MPANPSLHDEGLKAAISWVRGLSLIGDGDGFRPQAMSYVKPAEYQRQVNAVLERILAALPVEPPSEPNQCDGCRQGLELRDGQHYRDGLPWIGCTAYRYAAPVPAPQPPSAEAVAWLREHVGANDKWEYPYGAKYAAEILRHLDAATSAGVSPVTDIAPEKARGCATKVL